MAGFTTPGGGSNPFFKNVLNNLKRIGSFGMYYGDMVVKNSQGVGISEATFLKSGGIEDENFLYSLKRADTTSKQYIAYFDRDYKSKRLFLGQFSQNPEIEYILDTLCDECIVYDQMNYFGYLANEDIIGIGEDKENNLFKRYEEIYNLFGFNEAISAWHYFRKFLVEGIISFEIIFDDKGKNIIGFKELDPSSLLPSTEKQPDGSFTEIWIQYPDNPQMTRKLYDSQIIYISYAKGNTTSRVSYVERLIRSFNLLRIMEHTRIIWNVMNSCYRLTMTVPIGSKSPQKAKQRLGELMSIYKEDIQLNTDSGELSINGRPNLQFFKNYLMPSTPTGTPDIKPLAGSGDGKAFTDVKALAFFADKLKLDSKIPYTRFDRDDKGTSGTYSGNAEGLDQEEIRFFKFVTRLRSIFQDILVKPLWVQFCLDYPEHQKDWMIKGQLGLDYNKDNNFAENQYKSLLQARKEQVTKLAGLVDAEGKPYFSLNFVIDRWFPMRDEDKSLNEKFKKRTAEKKRKAAETSAYQPATEEEGDEEENQNPNSPEKLKDDGGSFENGEAGKDNTPKNK
jgi:hypothetical protein